MPDAMTLPTPEHIAELSPVELVALVTELIAAVQRLEAENQRLKAENQQLKAAAEREPLPPPTSQNSSQPPSRDVKRNLAGKRKRHGPPFGHARQIGDKIGLAGNERPDLRGDLCIDRRSFS